jgi:hypothetical protein
MPQIIPNHAQQLFDQSFSQGLAGAMQAQMQERQFKQQQSMEQDKIFQQLATDPTTTPEVMKALDPKVGARMFGGKAGWEAFQSQHVQTGQQMRLLQGMVQHAVQQGVDPMQPGAMEKFLAGQPGVTPDMMPAVQQAASSMATQKYPMAEAQLKGQQTAAVAAGKEQSAMDIAKVTQAGGIERAKIAAKARVDSEAMRTKTMAAIAGGKQSAVDKNFAQNYQKLSVSYPKDWQKMYDTYKKAPDSTAKATAGAEMQTQAWANVQHALTYADGLDNDRAAQNRFLSLARQMPFQARDGSYVLGLENAAKTYKDPADRANFMKQVAGQYQTSLQGARTDREGMMGYFGAGEAAGLSMSESVRGPDAEANPADAADSPPADTSSEPTGNEGE